MCVCSHIVYDFITSASSQSGYGCFRGIETAAKFAQSLSRNSLQNFRRYNIVPRQFFQCLQAMGILDAVQVPKHVVTIDAAKAILEEAGLHEMLTRSEYFDLGLQIQSGTQQHV